MLQPQQSVDVAFCSSYLKFSVADTTEVASLFEMGKQYIISQIVRNSTLAMIYNQVMRVKD